MRLIRRRLGVLSAVVAALQTWIVTVGLASCCISVSAHRSDDPEVCPMVHAQGDTCPMHDKASGDTYGMTASPDKACRIACASPGTHALLQSAAGGPLPAPVAVVAMRSSTDLPFDVPPQTLDPGGHPFSPPPRG